MNTADQPALPLLVELRRSANITRSRATVQALAGVDLQIRRQEFWAIGAPAAQVRARC